MMDIRYPTPCHHNTGKRTYRVIPCEAKTRQDSFYSSQEIIDTEGGGEELEDLTMPA
jgi:hypothetical protein